MGSPIKLIRHPRLCHTYYTPGGESTAMAIVGEQHGIFPRLKAFVQSGKPVRRGRCDYYY